LPGGPGFVVLAAPPDSLGLALLAAPAGSSLVFVTGFRLQITCNLK
jgi:hypothetical protein